MLLLVNLHLTCFCLGATSSSFVAFLMCSYSSASFFALYEDVDAVMCDELDEGTNRQCKSIVNKSGRLYFDYWWCKVWFPHNLLTPRKLFSIVTKHIHEIKNDQESGYDKNWKFNTKSQEFKENANRQYNNITIYMHTSLGQFGTGGNKSRPWKATV